MKIEINWKEDAPDWEDRFHSAIAGPVEMIVRSAGRSLTAGGNYLILYRICKIPFQRRSSIYLFMQNRNRKLSALSSLLNRPKSGFREGHVSDAVDHKRRIF